ncbi:FAD-dependent oxidoreductase [Nonomuraea salmonea]|uniref:FAD-dependent oxidoreductase n=1 Tax=Nonomuraea salmonea TaxID=46181 RepID=UPI0031ECFB13
METSDITDVLVVGAGPVGLTLACELARRDVRVRIIDRATVHPAGTRARGGPGPHPGGVRGHRRARPPGRTRRTAAPHALLRRAGGTWCAR